MLIIGHRGACGYAPENTLLSFEKAIELGVDMVEFDVHMCKTGELIVMHDNSVNRTTNGQGRIEDLSLDELKTLDAGQGQKIPTLEEVLDYVNKRVKVNIEIKSAGIAEYVFKTINKYIKERGWDLDYFFITSFHFDELADFRKFDKNTKIGLLYPEYPFGYREKAAELNAYSINLFYDIINNDLIDDIHSNGLKVLVWTGDTKKEIKNSELWNVDGIFSNYPDKI